MGDVRGSLDELRPAPLNWAKLFGEKLALERLDGSKPWPPGLSLKEPVPVAPLWLQKG